MRRLCLLISAGLVLAGMAASAGGWANEAADVFNNRLEFPVGGAQELQIGGGTRTWYWYGANAIGFKGDNPNLSWDDINGGEAKRFAIKLAFSHPVLAFSFVLPTMNNMVVNPGGTVTWSYSTDGKEWHELWRHQGKDGQPVTVTAVTTPEQKLTAPTDQLWLAYSLDKGFGGNIQFGPAAGGRLKLTLAEKVLARAKPDQPGRLYYRHEPLRLTIGPLKHGFAWAIRDLTRDIELAKPPLEAVGNYWYANLPTGRCGLYELTVRLADGTPACAFRWAVINPPLPATLEQIRTTPFGINFIAPPGMTHETMMEVCQMLGIHGTRGYMTPDWLTGEPAPGKYVWQDDPTPVDCGLTGLLGWGMAGYGSVCWTPRWAVDEAKWTDRTVNFIHYPPKADYYRNYRAFCKALAARYKGYVNVFQTYNEPNNEPFGSWKGTIEDWAKLNRAAQDGLKAGNPRAKLLGPVAGGVDLGHIKRCWELVGNDLWDIIDVHPYRHDGSSPETGNLLGDIRRTQKLIREHGRNQPIYFSELGWSTFLPRGKSTGCYISVTPLQQAWYVQRTYLLSVAAGVKHIDYFVFSDWGPSMLEPEHNFGIVDHQGAAKPSGVAFSGLTRHLEGATFRGVWPTPEPKHYAFAWALRNRKSRPFLNGLPAQAELLTVWCDQSRPGEAAAPVTGKPVKLPGKPLYVEDMFGEPAPDRVFATGTDWFARAGEDPLYIYTAPVPAKALEALPDMSRSPKSLSVLPLGQLTPDNQGDEWPAAPAATVGDAGAPPLATFKVGATDRGLCLWVDVKDAEPFNNPQQGWLVWAGDCIELFFDTAPEKNQPWFTEATFQIGLAPVTKDSEQPAAILINAGNPKYRRGQALATCRMASRKTADGWCIEAEIPWAELGLTRPAKGAIWGFDVAVDGASGNGHPETRWNGAFDNWSNPERFGRIVFP